MIIFDFSLALQANVRIISKAKENVTVDNLRIRLLDHILNINKKFKRQYGSNIILALDSGSWRKKIFPYYKFKREEKRQADEYDWKTIYSHYEVIINEINDFFPYSILKVKGAEGDDIVATLCKEIRNEEIMIISRDKDFMQLHRNENVSQYDPIVNKMISVTEDIDYHLFHHIMKGDESDGIPCIYSPETFYTQSLRPRQQTVYQNVVREIYKYSDQELKKYFDNKEVFKRFEQNRRLISLDHIDEEVKNNILNTYKSFEPRKARVGVIMEYLREKKLTSLFMDEIYYF